MSGLQIRLDVRGAERASNLLDKAPDVVLDEMETATYEGNLLIEREVRERTPAGVGAGGGLRGSIHSQRPRRSFDGIIGVTGTSALHAIPVEVGTKPHFPPLAPLVEWVKVKLGLSDNEAYAAARGVQRKIGRKGTEGAHMFEKGLEAAEPQIETIYERALDRAEKRIAGGAA